jgi:hypothetical protein
MQSTRSWLTPALLWERAPDALALIVAAICTSTVLGFLLDVQQLSVDLGARLPLAFNGCLVALFCAAWVIGTPVTRAPNARVARLFQVGALIALALVSATLAEHVFAIDLGIDVAPRRAVPVPFPHPGRIAPNTCMGLIAALLSILLAARGGALGGGWRARGAQAFAIVTLLVGALGILGYSFQFDTLYEWYRANQMALVTALCLTCLGVALTLRLQTRLAAERGPMSADTRVNYISTVLLVGISLISVLVAFATVKNGTEETIRRDLQQVVEARRALLLANLRSANALARSVSVEPSIVDLLSPRSS